MQVGGNSFSRSEVESEVECEVKSKVESEVESKVESEVEAKVESTAESMALGGSFTRKKSCGPKARKIFSESATIEQVRRSNRT